MKRKANASPAATSLAMSTKPRRRNTITVLFAAAIALLLALPSFASADPLGAVTLFKEGFRAKPDIKQVTEGPDGNVWFIDTKTGGETTSAIGKITEGGTITTYALTGLNAGANLSGITAGPDGKLWLTDTGTTPGIVVVDPASPTVATEYNLAAGSLPRGIVTGPDGNLWFANKSATAPMVAAFSPTETKVVKECTAELTPGESTPTVIVTGADGNLWFSDTQAIGRANPTTCEIKKFSTGEESSPGGTTVANTGPWGMTAGPDGNVWFSEGGNNTTEGRAATGKAIGRITPSGTITYFSTGLVEKSTPLSLTAANGKLWFTDSSNVVEQQKFNFVTGTGAWVNGNKFKLCYEAQCEEVEYSSTPATLKARVETALKNIPAIGAGNTVISATASSATVTFEVGELIGQNMAQISCEVTAGEGLCLAETKKDGAYGAIGRVTTSGVITRYPIEKSLLTMLGITRGPGGNVWFSSGRLTTQRIVKFGIEEEEPGPELTVTKEGTGDGTVVSNPAGIECGGTCASTKFKEGEKVTLTVSPDSESLFVSWKGCETGGVNGRQCKVTMDKAKTVVAKFIQAYDVSVTRKGSGLGKISSTPSGILCLSNCSSTSAKFKELTNVTLTAAPSKNFTFAGWSGDCVGTGTCVLSSLSEDKEVEAEFLEVAKHVLSMSKKGGGQGTVKTNLPGINCGATCSSMAAAFYQGSEVELTQAPGKGSTFGGWSGDCSGTGTCKVTMSAAKSVEAEFK